MASISTDKKTGNRTIQFMDGGSRRSIWLGKMQKRTAESWKSHIEELISARNEGRSPFQETTEWLGRLSDSHHNKLAGVGLVQKRATAEATTLEVFLSDYRARRTDVKSGTQTAFRQVCRCLIDHFGPDKPLSEITPADTDDWRRWLLRPKDQGGQGLSDNTARRRCGIARQFFRDAMRRRLIGESPFADMKEVSVRENRKRDYFITREEAQKVLEACPDADWRLIFALSRYGGLRCPSEHLALRWGDIDWNRGRITIRSSKTEHHEGKAARIIPLWPELRPHLEAVLNELLKDFDPKLQRLSEQRVIRRYVDVKANLRTQFERIVRRAGLEPWPKLFQNLRATRETELAQKYPIHVVCAWMGNSKAIAAKHYLQVTDEDYESALRPEHGNLQNPMQSAAVTDTQGHVEKKEPLASTREYEGLRYLLPLQVSPAGLEQNADSSRNVPNPSESLAESYAKSKESTPALEELMTVLTEWQRLPVSVRSAIMDMVQRGGREGRSVKKKDL